MPIDPLSGVSYELDQQERDLQQYANDRQNALTDQLMANPGLAAYLKQIDAARDAARANAMKEIMSGPGQNLGFDMKAGSLNRGSGEQLSADLLYDEIRNAPLEAQASPALARPASGKSASGKSAGKSLDEMHFGDAFALSRKKGERAFNWHGKSYTTMTREEAARVKELSKKPATGFKTEQPAGRGKVQYMKPSGAQGADAKDYLKWHKEVQDPKTPVTRSDAVGPTPMEHLMSYVADKGGSPGMALLRYLPWENVGTYDKGVSMSERGPINLDNLMQLMLEGRRVSKGT
jgi:hypothetical protein